MYFENRSGERERASEKIKEVNKMKRKKKVHPYFLIAALSLFLAACSPVVTQAVGIAPNNTENPVIGSDNSEGNVNGSENPFEGISLGFNPNFWPDTDFTKHSVDYSEFFSGGPPPDGIPAIDNPIFEDVETADRWLGDDWPIMFFELNGDARAYPLAILIFHEIVNDVVSDVPVALTFCPLCNSTIAFDSTLEDGSVLDFGTTGNLRNSDLVMYDRQTNSWWQQFTGEGIVGELTGTQLELLPSQIIAWSDFKVNHRDGQVLSRETGSNRPYGNNPYGGYDSIESNPFFPITGNDSRLLPKDRVVALEIDDLDVAYPFSVLSEIGVINDIVSEQPLVVFWEEGTQTIFGNSGADTGSSSAFLRTVDGVELNFVEVDGGFQDVETGSLWNIFGEAIEGDLEGSKLEQLVSAEHFWFAWSTFKPDTMVWAPAG
jgi:hypothetical protein